MQTVASLYLDLNSYFASVEQQEDPRLVGRPLAVLPNNAKSGCCIAVSYEAKACGVKTGMYSREAQQLCPDIRFRPARHDVYVAYHHRIKAEVENHLPIEAVCSIDEFSCALRGPDSRLETALELSRAIKAGIRRNIGPAVQCSIGLAPNRLLAKIAGEFTKPDGLDWILPDELEKLHRLKLTDIPGVSRGIERRLRKARIFTIPDLLALPPRRARMIWGNVEGERMVRALRGETVIRPETQRRFFGHSQMLAPGNRSPAVAEPIARHLLVKAARRMRREDLSAGRLFVSCRTQDHRFSREISFPSTSADLDLLAVFGTVWRGFDLPDGAPLKKVSVALGGLTHQGKRTADLFLDGDAATNRPSEALSEAVDAIFRRYGGAAISYGPRPAHLVSYSGARIAFNHIPDGDLL